MPTLLCLRCTRRGTVRPIQLALLLPALLLLGNETNAQSIRLGPGGVEITPRREVEPPPPPARALPAPRDELRERMLGLRDACEDGDRRACIRLGVIIGENR